MIREARHEDLQQILELYLHLHETAVPEESENLCCAWQKIMSDNNHHLVVCEVDGKIVSSCVCVIIPNLTRGVRSYAFVENVVTHADYRGKGYATACLNYTRELAQKEITRRLNAMERRTPQQLHDERCGKANGKVYRWTYQSVKNILAEESYTEPKPMDEPSPRCRRTSNTAMRTSSR